MVHDKGHHDKIMQYAPSTKIDVQQNFFSIKQMFRGTILASAGGANTKRQSTLRYWVKQTTLYLTGNFIK